MFNDDNGYNSYDDNQPKVYRTEAIIQNRNNDGIFGYIAGLTFIIFVLCIFSTGGYFLYKYLNSSQKEKEVKKITLEEDQTEQSENDKKLVHKQTIKNLKDYPKIPEKIKKELKEKEEDFFNKKSITESKVIVVKGDKSKVFKTTDQSKTDVPSKNKFIDKYFYLNEEQLIEEVRDSLVNDYNYYDKKNLKTADQVRQIIINKSESFGYHKLLDEVLSKGFAPKYSSATDTINLSEIAFSTVRTPIFNNKTEMFEVLLKHKVNLKALEGRYKHNLLHEIAKYGNADIAKLVIEAGIPIEDKTTDGKTAVYYAIKNNHYFVFKLLVDKGAELKQEYCELTNDRNILFLIIQKVNPKAYSYLNFEQTNKQWEEFNEYLVNGDFESIKTLVDCGTDITNMSYNGEGAPLIAIRNGGLKTISYLMKNINCQNNIDTINKRNCLHYAVMYKKLEKMQLLLKNGFDPNLTDRYGNTPLHYAAENDDIEYVKLLLRNGADSKILNKRNQNPLFYAVASENTAIFKTLIKNGADIEQKDINGNTPLMFANNNHLDKSKSELIKLGADKSKIGYKDLNSDEKHKDIKKVLLKKMKEIDLDPIFSSSTITSENTLFNQREYLLGLKEDQIIDFYEKLYSNIKSRIYRERNEGIYYSNKCKLFITKIAFDNDYPNLFNKILDDGFDIDFWKFDYLPPVMYLAEKNREKCLNLYLEKKQPNLAMQLDYKEGFAYNINKNTCRNDREILYSIKYVSAQDGSKRKWGEAILNLGDDISYDVTDENAVNYLDLGKTLLHSAAQNGNIILAKKVLAAGVSINQITNNGNTPLYYAVKNNQYEMAQFLIENGAKISDSLKTLTKDSKMLEILGKIK